MNNIINKIKQHYNIVAGVIALIYVLREGYDAILFGGKMPLEIEILLLLGVIGFLIVAFTMFFIKFDKFVIIGLMCFILRAMIRLSKIDYTTAYCGIIIVYTFVILGILKEDIIRKYYLVLLVGCILVYLKFVSINLHHNSFLDLFFDDIFFNTNYGIISYVSLISCITLYFRNKYISKD